MTSRAWVTAPARAYVGVMMNRSKSLWRGVVAFISALAVLFGVTSAAVAEVKDISEWKPVAEPPVDSWYEPAYGDAPTSRPNALGTLVRISNSQMPSGLTTTLGMCIDTMVPSPEQKSSDGYLAPKKLESIVSPDVDEFKEKQFETVPFEGQIRDSAIHVAKQALKAWNEKNADDFADYSVALQYLLSAHRTSTYEEGAFGERSDVEQKRARASRGLTAEKFKEITGYAYSAIDPTATSLTFKYDSSVEIPKAGDDEYLTILEPENYQDHFTRATNGRVGFDDDVAPQIVVPIDQPGLNMDEPNNFTPKISTSISPKSVSNLDEDIALTDTVTYEGLAPNTEYKLTGQLVDQANPSETVGFVDSVRFTTGAATEPDGSVKGTQEVPITIATPYSDLRGVNAAVAFEELTSTVVDAQGNPLKEQTTTLIAEHKDVNDRAQTVTVEVPEELNPAIKTSAELQSENGQVVAGATVVDTVAYTDLLPGKEYTLSAQLMDKADGTTVVGEGSKLFAPESANGTVDVEIAVTSEEPVAAAVAFETLTSEDKEAQENKDDDLPPGSAENVIAEHKDINDAAQTVTSVEPQENPKLELKKYINGSDAQDAGKPGAETVEVEPSSTMTIKYVVTNTGTVDLTGVTITDEVTGGASKEKIAADIKAELSQVAPFDVKAGASKVVEITVSTPANGGETHRDVAQATGQYTPEGSSELQKVVSNEDEANAKTPKKQFAPLIRTSVNPKSAVLSSGMTVTDTVSYEGLVPNTEYTLKASLVDKADKSKVLGSSEPVTFTTGAATEADGSVKGSQEVSITVTASDEQLKDVTAAVAFEGLSSKVVDKAGNPLDEPVETPIAEHKDINDEAQTVSKPAPIVLSDMPKPPRLSPKITTLATVISSREAGQIVAGTAVQDRVYFTDLVVGAKYTLNGQLIDKADGSTVVGAGSLEFIAEAAESSVMVPIKVTVDKPVAAAVVFETLTSSEVKADGSKNPDGSEQVIAEHKDINDEAQTVRGDVLKENQFSPQIVTSLNPKSALLESGMTITDTVSFEGLAPNTEYTLKASLVDKADKSKVLGSSEPVTFTTGAATEADGSVKGSQPVEITVTASDEQLKDVTAAVAFEELTSQVVDKAGNPLDEPAETPIAEHKDINDAAQTVTNKPIPNEFEPSIAISVEPKEALLAPGLEITDTVSYEGLAPNTTYTFKGTLVDTADSSNVLGESDTVTFTTGSATEPDGSVKGTQKVEITVTATEEALKTVKKAAVFEELTSTDVNKAGNASPNSKGNVIAEYKKLDEESPSITNTYDEEADMLKASGAEIDPNIQTRADCRQVTDENYWPQDCSIINPDPTISAYSAPEVRSEGVAKLLEPINEAAGQKVIEYKDDPERNFIRIVVHPDYDLGSHGDRFSDIQKALRQYGYTEIELVA